MEHVDDPRAGGNSAAEGGGGDQETTTMMVRFELEAAEALAGLAHSSMLPAEDDDRSEAWDHNKNLPPQGDDGATVVVLQEEQSEKKKTAESDDAVKFDDEHRRPELGCGTSCNAAPVGGGRSRLPLTETEKEARRLRRVLANRESARQTIRRRQAMYEELGRKASDLALENENLKREKELAIQEYDSLRNTHDCLKEQMAKLEVTEAGEIQQVTKPVPTVCPASAAATSTCTSLQSSPVPLPWPSLIQPTLQCRSQNDNATLPVFPSTETWRPCLVPDQRNCSSTNPCQGALLYVLPLPCIFHLNSFPLNAAAAALPQSSNRVETQIGSTHQGNQCSICPPCQYSSLPSIVNRETSGQAIITDAGDDHRQASFGAPIQNRTVLMPTTLNCVRPSSSCSGGPPNAAPQQESSGEKAVTGIAASEENREQGRKPVNESSAAKARRRRRELMRLKTIH